MEPNGVEFESDEYERHTYLITMFGFLVSFQFFLHFFVSIRHVLPKLLLELFPSSYSLSVFTKNQLQHLGKICMYEQLREDAIILVCHPSQYSISLLCCAQRHIYASFSRSVDVWLYVMSFVMFVLFLSAY